MKNSNYYTFDTEFHDIHIQKTHKFSGKKFHNTVGHPDKLQRLIKRNLAVQDSYQFIQKFRSLATTTLNSSRSKTEVKKCKIINRSVQIPNIQHKGNISINKQFKAVITNKNKYSQKQSISDFPLPTPYANFKGTFGKMNGTILTRFKVPKPGIIKYHYKKSQSPQLIAKQKVIKLENSRLVKYQKSQSRKINRNYEFQTFLTGERKSLFQKQAKTTKFEASKVTEFRSPFTIKQIERPIQYSYNPQTTDASFGGRYGQYLNARYQEVCPWKYEEDQKGIQVQH